MIYFDKLCLENKDMNIFFWGTGRTATEIYDRFAEEIQALNIIGFIDNEPEKQGKIFNGYQVWAPDILRKHKNCFVIILCKAGNKIAEQIMESHIFNVVKCEDYHYFIKYRLLERYRNENEPEIKEIISYVENRSLEVFNYPFYNEYRNKDYIIEYDLEAGLFYAYFEGKKMYFSRKYKKQEGVLRYMREIMAEQDSRSPHCYFTSKEDVAWEGAVIIDADAAEGNFALSIVDKAKRIYLVEGDAEWAEALKYTFALYKDKVIIVNKYLSNYSSKETITIDEMCEEEIDYIKMDIEGEELYALQGGIRTFSKSRYLKCIVCTYHQEFDYMLIESWLQKTGMKTESSCGYMWFSYDKDYLYSLPTLRRGLLIGTKGELNYE